MAEYTPRNLTQTVMLLDINGKEVDNIESAVVRTVNAGMNSTLYIRIEGLSPAHHERMPKVPVMNPEFAKVDEDIMKIYMGYLETKREGLHTQVKNLMVLKGLI